MNFRKCEINNYSNVLAQNNVVFCLELVKIEGLFDLDFPFMFILEHSHLKVLIFVAGPVHSAILVLLAEQPV